MKNALARSFLFVTLLCSSFYTSPILANTAESSSDIDASSSLLFDPGLEWNLETSENAIRIYTRPEQGSGFRAFKATTIIDSPIADLLAVLADAPSCPLWVENCIESGTVLLKSFEDRFGYALNDLPWPLKNRYVIVHIKTFQQSPSSNIYISMTTHDELTNDITDQLATPENIRLNKSKTQYILSPLDEGKTQLTWMQHADPEGTLPSWFVNMMITELPLKSLAKLKEIVNLPRYQNAELIYNEANKLQGLRLSNGEHINQPEL